MDECTNKLNERMNVVNEIECIIRSIKSATKVSYPEEIDDQVFFSLRR